MKPYEREFLIARIACEYLTCPSKGGYNLRIHSPTKQQLYESGNIYTEAYNKAIIDGVLTEEDIAKIMEENELWTKEDEKILKGVYADVEKLKLGVFKLATNKHRQDIIRRNLRSIEKVAEKLFRKKNVYSSVTCEGYAFSKQLIWTIENTTCHLDGSPYDWKDDETEELVSFYQQEQISDQQIRDLAKSNEWRSTWSASKVESRVFGKAGVDLTSEQKNLIAYSRMYDSVYESMDCPMDSVIQDDDALDGWFIAQKENREQQQKEAGTEDMLSDKTKDADEVMLMVNPDDEEGIQSIYDMNDIRGKSVTKSRFNQVEEQGEVKFHEFGDVKREKQMQQTRGYSDKIKGRK
jgi:hypothetical protein